MNPQTLEREELTAFLGHKVCFPLEAAFLGIKRLVNPWAGMAWVRSISNDLTQRAECCSKGEPWLRDIQARWEDPDFASYNLVVVAYKITLDVEGLPQPPSLAAHAWIGFDGDTGELHLWTSVGGTTHLICVLQG